MAVSPDKQDLHPFKHFLKSFFDYDWESSHEVTLVANSKPPKPEDILKEPELEEKPEQTLEESDPKLENPQEESKTEEKLSPEQEKDLDLIFGVVYQ